MFAEMVIWREFVPVLALFDYAVFHRNHYTGHLIGVDWVAVDVLLKRENVTVTPDDFANWRIALSGYIDVINENIDTANQ